MTEALEGVRPGEAAEGFLPPALGTSTSASNPTESDQVSTGAHEVSCICGIPDNAKGGLLVECDSCKSWSHTKCYNLDDQTASIDEYEFFCAVCHPHPLLSLPTSTANGSAHALL